MDGQHIIGFIGGGNMARAMVRGLLRVGHPAAAIRISDPDPAQREAIAALGPTLRVDSDNAPVAADADALVLAVKPQILPQVALTLTTRAPEQLVISIAAGVSVQSLNTWFPDAPLVRVMPNQPAVVGAGISVLHGAPSLDARHRELAEYVMSSAGRTVWLPDESLMDAVTAVSGSGPAYFYLLMEAMEAAALELGLAPDLAAILTRETALGAARVVRESGEQPEALRRAVTSPGGTTAAALGVFADGDVMGIVRRALTAARDRSRELGRITAGPTAANDPKWS